MFTIASLDLPNQSFTGWGVALVFMVIIFMFTALFLAKTLDIGWKGLHFERKERKPEQKATPRIDPNQKVAIGPTVNSTKPVSPKLQKAQTKSPPKPTAKADQYAKNKRPKANHPKSQP